MSRFFKLSKKRHIIVLLGIIAGIIWFFTGHGAMVGRIEEVRDTNREIGLWTSGTRIEQSFLASQNNLSRIDFALDSYHPWDSPYLELRVFELHLEQAPYELPYNVIHQGSQEIRYKRINGWLLSPHMFNRVEFEPIPDSRGKRYLFSIQSPGLKQGGNSILLASSRKRLETETFFVSGEKQERDLAFRVLYARPRIQLLKESIARLALGKPFPFSEPLFYYLLFGSYFLLSLLLGWWMFHRLTTEK